MKTFIDPYTGGVTYPVYDSYFQKVVAKEINGVNPMVYFDTVQAIVSVVSRGEKFERIESNPTSMKYHYFHEKHLTIEQEKTLLLKGAYVKIEKSQYHPDPQRFIVVPFEMFLQNI